jgi:hypothetical protein
LFSKTVVALKTTMINNTKTMATIDSSIFFINESLIGLYWVNLPLV